METAIVTNVQGYSIHDGPGIRTVVFLKGCPLGCAWCANPENLSGRVEAGFLERLCTGCGRCFSACGHGAIVAGEGVCRIDRARCVACGDCVRACFYGALVLYGEEMTSEAAFGKVRRDKMFYDASGGGVTVSGGEPLLRPGFVRELFGLCRGEGIDTRVETCGEAPRGAFEEVLPVADGFLFDLKLMDAVGHEAWTGVSNERILENARFLAGEGADVLFRLPLVPGVNDGEGNILRTAEFLKGLGEGRARLEIMPYHRMGEGKYAALGLGQRMAGVKIMTKMEIDATQKAFLDLGVECTVSR